jgi:hypothetical protein
MKALLSQVTRWILRQIWAIIVAYMLGMHNFYMGENKSSDDILITIEHNEVQENGTPKD